MAWCSVKAQGKLHLLPLTLCTASEGVYIVSVYFVIDSVRRLLVNTVVQQGWETQYWAINFWWETVEKLPLGRRRSIWEDAIKWEIYEVERWMILAQDYVQL
jgi:hypothetical protein